MIEPAINDINTHANYTVQWTQSKTGRRVTHLNFVFDEKQNDKSPAHTKELTIGGVKYSEISHLAKPGESWEQAAARIKAKKAGKLK